MGFFVLLIKKNLSLFLSSDFTENVVVPYHMRVVGNICRIEVAAVMDSLSN